MIEDMNTSDAAETIVRIALEETEFVLRLSGSAAAYLAPLILAKLQEKKDSPGKTKLVKLLRSERPLKIFTIKSDNINEFKNQAKIYGVQYAELKEKNVNKDNIVDIIVKAEDAARINRIVDRFKLAEFSEAQVSSEIGKESVVNSEITSEEAVKSADNLVADILFQPEKGDESPLLGKEIKNQLENFSIDKNNQSSAISNDKASVRENLKKIKEEQIKNELLNNNEKVKIKTDSVKHQQPKTKKKKRKAKQR